MPQPTPGPGPDDPLWELVPLGAYEVPTGPDQRLMRRKWATLRHLFRARDKEAQAPVKAEAELRTLPGARLENLVPPIDWAPAAEALDRTLGDRPKPVGVHFLIGQPHCRHGTILEHWATARDVHLVTPPSGDTVLAGDDSWLTAACESEQPWVLPALEHCFLRHTAGLSVVRRILERAVSGRLGAALIGCDGWAWAYLQHIFPAPQLPTLTLQAFDGRRLADLFIRLSGAAPGGPVTFRNACTGAPVLPDPELLAAGEAEIGRELKQLAVHCRGNPGLAWAYWRKRLRAEPETEEADRADGPEQSSPPNGHRDTLWLTDPLDDPVPPAERADDFLLILHALLLHNGLPADVIPELLPLPDDQIVSLMARLEALGMVEHYAGLWHVAALGYATARDMLKERGFLVDPF